MPSQCFSDVQFWQLYNASRAFLVGIFLVFNHHATTIFTFTQSIAMRTIVANTQTHTHTQITIHKMTTGWCQRTGRRCLRTERIFGNMHHAHHDTSRPSFKIVVEPRQTVACVYGQYAFAFALTASQFQGLVASLARRSTLWQRLLVRHILLVMPTWKEIILVSVWRTHHNAAAVALSSCWHCNEWSSRIYFIIVLLCSISSRPNRESQVFLNAMS